MNDTVDYLNVDEISPEIAKVISIKGKKHSFKSPTVGEFLEEMKRIAKLQKQFEKRTDVSDDEAARLMVQALKHSIRMAFPTVTDEELDGLNFAQMEAIKSYITEELEEVNEAAKDDLGNDQPTEQLSKA